MKVAANQNIDLQSLMARTKASTSGVDSAQNNLMFHVASKKMYGPDDP